MFLSKREKECFEQAAVGKTPVEAEQMASDASMSVTIRVSRLDGHPQVLTLASCSSRANVAVMAGYITRVEFWG